ncbi:hypothetical protein ACPCG0_11280 [Propionibacteriaceae bacterium Y1923]
MFDQFEPTTWFALGYAVTLLLVAHGIDKMSRRAALTVEQNQRGGFVYHADHDAWVCPEDQWLWPQSFDPENRVMRYRSTPSVCNACPVRDSCTTSDSGREVQRQVDPWPASESARFHRGIACTVAVLACAWPVAAALSGPSSVEVAVLLGTTVLVLLGSLPLWSHLRRSPVDPAGVLFRPADDNEADRLALALKARARRTRYRSDRLAEPQAAPPPVEEPVVLPVRSSRWKP